jgi:hypothetical protein
MDPSTLVAIVLLIAALVLVPRYALEGLGRASDGLAQLFVPPDRTLRWPHGVQESDDPWGWHEAAAVAVDPVAPVVMDDAGDVAIEELPAGDGRLVVPVRRVRG